MSRRPDSDESAAQRTVAKKKKESAARSPKASKAAVRLEDNLGVGLAIVAGGVVGAITGPIGLVVGASVGAVVGELAGSALHDRHTATAKRDHGVDAAEKSLSSLRSDHEQLDRLAERVVDSVRAGDRSEAAAAIAAMQTGVLAHIDEEERKLLPAYAVHAPEDAAAIMADHAAMRKVLAELDVTTDLHLLRADRIEAFLTTLRAHADRENAGLYKRA